MIGREIDRERVMANRMLIGIVLALLAAGTALAAGPAEVRKQMEASMLVTGSLVLEPDGRVSAWELDRPEALAEPVVELITKAAGSWAFEPVTVDGEAVRAKARMSLRVVATPHDDDRFQLTIRSGHFGDDAMSAEERRNAATTDHVRSVRMHPPAYPPGALRAGVTGTVYLVMRINRDGRVQDVFAEQVNLRVVGTEREMERMREMLARPALAAARRWTFSIPTTGDDADDEYWSLRVPVEYMLHGDKVPGYGEWQAYIPGPRQKAPWSTRDLRADESPDAMIAGRVYQEGKGLKLLTRLGEG